MWFWCLWVLISVLWICVGFIVCCASVLIWLRCVYLRLRFWCCLGFDLVVVLGFDTGCFNGCLWFNLLWFAGIACS